MVDAIKAAKGIEVDRRHILLPEHIKETGSFEVTVELFRDVATIVTLEVLRPRGHGNSLTGGIRRAVTTTCQ